ncbi:MAG: hypothetical protein HRT35_34655 [Algicola sp.]|nr:hypothetical protein [Algicola sp.]
MSLPKVNLGLKLGKALPSAAPMLIMEALKSVQVTQGDSGPCTFQLTFNADRTGAFSNDYPILSSPLLKATNRVIISVSINSVEKVLMDGFITNTEINYTEQSGAASYTVTGEDVSVMMDLFQLSFPYPGMGFDLIAAAVLAKYMMLGVMPEIIPNLGMPISDPLERTEQQSQTDREFLKWLADQSGYIFRVRPLTPMTNKAYWGPLLHFGLPQPALNVNLGPLTNVEDVSFAYNALAPNLVHGFLQDDTLEGVDIPVITLQAVRLQPMAQNDGLTSNQPFVKNNAFEDPRLGAIGGLLEAQMATDRSTDEVVKGTISVDTLRYGSIVETPGVVPVRGMGQSYDGNYYVSSVTHTISKGEYKQALSLQREGTGSTITRVGELI